MEQRVSTLTTKRTTNTRPLLRWFHHSTRSTYRRCLLYRLLSRLFKTRTDTAPQPRPTLRLRHLPLLQEIIIVKTRIKTTFVTTISRFPQKKTINTQKWCSRDNIFPSDRHSTTHTIKTTYLSVNCCKIPSFQIF